MMIRPSTRSHPFVSGLSKLHEKGLFFNDLVFSPPAGVCGVPCTFCCLVCLRSPWTWTYLKLESLRFRCGHGVCLGSGGPSPGQYLGETIHQHVYSWLITHLLFIRFALLFSSFKTRRLVNWEIAAEFDPHMYARY